MPHRDLKPAEIEKRHEFAYAHADRPELVLTLWACSETVGSSTITTFNKAERNMAFRPEHDGLTVSDRALRTEVVR